MKKYFRIWLALSAVFFIFAVIGVAIQQDIDHPVIVAVTVFFSSMCGNTLYFGIKEWK